MTSDPKYKIGDRVARAIQDKRDFTRVVGWKRGTVVGVRREAMHTVMRSSFWYTITWDGGPVSDNGHWEGSLIPESEIS